MTDQEIEDSAFRQIALVYPHECYATWPERFWQLFQQERPGISREQMEILLKDNE